MGTKTIGLREEAYDRLKARKRDDESFTDLVERLLDEATTDWRDGFGSLETGEMETLERAAERSRTETSAGLAKRQGTALGNMVTAGETIVDEETDGERTGDEDVDETA